MALVLHEQSAPGVVTITLNDPNNLNAMGEEMAAEFSTLVRTLTPDAGKLRAIILTGAGRAFSAGGNLDMLEKKIKLSADENRQRMINFYNSFLGILQLGVPLIAAINGHAIGAGLCVASACDIRIASDQAKLGFTFAKLGLHPGMGATYFLPRVAGYSAAVELMITGRVVDAAQALALGVVSRVVETAKVVPTALEIAQEICACGPEAVRQLIQSVRSGPPTLHDALAREAACQAVNYASSEFKEGIRAAIEKRPAKF